MINIQIKNSEQLPGIQNAFVSFDEYNEKLINKLRMLKDRRYNPENKSWEIPLCDLEYFIGAAKDYPITIGIKNEKSEYIEIPKNYVFKTKSYQYQWDGIVYGLNHERFILADEQGLGKSFQALNIACIRKQINEIKHCLIICGVNSIKYNWEHEVFLHTNESAFVLGTRYTEHGKRKSGNKVSDRIADLKTHNEFFLITNVETLRNENFVKQLNKMSDSIGMIVLDEFHLCRNSNSAQTKGLLKLENFKYKMALSGTPIVNRPLDAYVGLKWLGLEKVSFSTFRKFYCDMGGVSGHQVEGYRNLSKLRESLAHNMLRRLKTDVLDLPEKIEQIEYIEMSDEQWKIYNEIREEILENIDLIAASHNPLTHLLRLRQATGDTSLLSSTVHVSAKLDRLEQIVDEIAENGRKCVIFSNWTQMTDIIRKRLKQYNPAYITGEVKDVEREAEKTKFTNDPSCKVCIGTIGALGTGHTLIAADTVIFLDLPWHRASLDQCADRIHRIGQQHTVHIIKMICVNTIDERINNIILRKGATADLLVDGKSRALSKQDLLNIIG